MDRFMKITRKTNGKSNYRHLRLAVAANFLFFFFFLFRLFFLFIRKTTMAGELIIGNYWSSQRIANAGYCMNVIKKNLSRLTVNEYRTSNLLRVIAHSRVGYYNAVEVFYRRSRAKASDRFMHIYIWPWFRLGATLSSTSLDLELDRSVIEV